MKFFIQLFIYLITFALSAYIVALPAIWAIEYGDKTYLLGFFVSWIPAILVFATGSFLNTLIEEL